jgi:hypothetical protein
MRDVDTSDERVIGYAEWNEREAKSLRFHRADSPSMPELAEMHEETAATLRALLAERDIALRDALRFHRERDKAEAERDRLRKACALAAAPLEAMILGETDKLHSADVQAAICQGRDAVRAALKETGHD